MEVTYEEPESDIASPRIIEAKASRIRETPEEDLGSESIHRSAREIQAKEQCESLLLEIREKLANTIHEIQRAEDETKEIRAQITSLLFPAHPEEFFSKVEGKKHLSLFHRIREVMRVPIGAHVKIFFLEEQIKTLQRIQMKNKAAVESLLETLFFIGEKSETEFRLLGTRSSGDLQNQEALLRKEREHYQLLLEAAHQARNNLPKTAEDVLEGEQHIKEYQSHLAALEERQLQLAYEIHWKEQILPYIRRYIEANSELEDRERKYYERKFKIAAQKNPLGEVDPLGAKNQIGV